MCREKPELATDKVVKIAAANAASSDEDVEVLLNAGAAADNPARVAGQPAGAVIHRRRWQIWG